MRTFALVKMSLIDSEISGPIPRWLRVVLVL